MSERLSESYVDCMSKWVSERVILTIACVKGSVHSVLGETNFGVEVQLEACVFQFLGDLSCLLFGQLPGTLHVTLA